MATRCLFQRLCLQVQFLPLSTGFAACALLETHFAIVKDRSTRWCSEKFFFSLSHFYKPFESLSVSGILGARSEYCSAARAPSVKRSCVYSLFLFWSGKPRTGNRRSSSDTYVGLADLWWWRRWCQCRDQWSSVGELAVYINAISPFLPCKDSSIVALLQYHHQ